MECFLRLLGKERELKILLRALPPVSSDPIMFIPGVKYAKRALALVDPVSEPEQWKTLRGQLGLYLMEIPEGSKADRLKKQ